MDWAFKGAQQTSLQPLLGKRTHGRSTTPGQKVILKRRAQWITTWGSSEAPVTFLSTEDHQRLGKYPGKIKCTAGVWLCRCRKPQLLSAVSSPHSPSCCACIFSKPWLSESSGINWVNVRGDVWVAKCPQIVQSNLHNATCRSFLVSSHHWAQKSGVRIPV